MVRRKHFTIPRPTINGAYNSNASEWFVVPINIYVFLIGHSNKNRYSISHQFNIRYLPATALINKIKNMSLIFGKIESVQLKT